MDLPSGAIREYVLSALGADVDREFGAAAAHLRLARMLAPYRNRALRHQMAACAAAALANASALAEEMAALGGVPPVPRLRGRERRTVSELIDAHVREARAALSHYSGRRLMARQFGLFRLQDVFADIVRNKRGHLGHAGFVAGAITRVSAIPNQRERSNANCSTHE